jgi:DedD protein
MLDVGAKRRLTGAAVLVVLVVVFLPMLVEEDAVQESVPGAALRMPDPPTVPRGQQAEIFPGPNDAALHPKQAQEPARPPGSGVVTEPETEAESEPEAVPDPAPVEVAKTPAAATTAQVAPPKTESGKPEPLKVKPSPEAAPAKPKAAGPKPVPKGLTSWVVQVAALGTPEAAERLQADLRRKGFHAFVEKREGDTRTFWRVRVGPEVERSRADALAADVKRQTGLEVIVRKYGGG